MAEPINNDPVKDHVDEYLVRAKAIIEGKKPRDLDHEWDIEIDVDGDDNEWLEIFPGFWELIDKNKVQNIFNKKEPSDDDLGRPTNRP